jgi:tRNA (Thr-GGU) A37 N-methylase
MSINLTPIGFVRGGRSEATDDDWGSVRARIELDPTRFAPDALEGLSTFSHAEIIFHFNLVPETKIVAGARHPRGQTDWPKVGIFAQRGKNRPNRLGVSVCTIIEVKGLCLEVQGLDAIDGTPVLDIKPVLKGFLPREDIVEPDWAGEIMAQYW